MAKKRMTKTQKRAAALEYYYRIGRARRLKGKRGKSRNKVN